MKIFVFLVLMSVFMYGCRFMGSTSLRKKPAATLKTTSKNTESNLSETRDSTNNVLREKSFTDTTEIDIVLKTENVEIKENASVIKFKEALAFFNNEEYDKSCEIFKKIQDSFSAKDSLFFEVEFYRSECLIMDNKLDESEILLNNIIGSKITSQDLIQRTIVRLGQIYCTRDNKSEATKFFNRLKKEYPKSIYLPLADCKSVKK